MARFRNPVLVLGGGVTGLGVARTLGRRGINVYMVVDQKDVAIFGKYCKKSFIVPRFRYNKEVLENFLRKFGKSPRKRIVVYPTSDLDALNLSELKEILADDFHFVVGDKEAVEILANKSKFYKALDRNGISYPNTYFVEDTEGVRRIGSKIPYPIFIRPSITQLFTGIFGNRRKGFIAYSLRELVTYYRLATRYGIEVMLQEIIPGPPSNSYQLEGYYDMNHRPTILFARQRLRIWPPGFGNTTLCVSIPMAELAKEKEDVNELIRTIGYSGLMSAEFKKDLRDGTLKFLEVNARAWWHFWLSARCGADIIFSSYLDAIGEETKYIDIYETGVKSVYLTLDLVTSACMMLTGDLSFLDWASSLNGPKEFAYFRKDDLSPFIMNCADQIFSHALSFRGKNAKVLKE